jgi:glycosyltransferase involved in cell wall biosynthesis
MRIAVANRDRRKIGGAERYVADIIPALRRDGHQVALLSEVDVPEGRERIALPDDAWIISERGRERALNDLRAWRPDLIYVQGLADPALEEELLGVAPAVLFAHTYIGTCISGGKTFKFPDVRPCDRRFGAACLLFYFPRRCGGLSPITMWQEFRLQSRRLEIVRRYRAIVTASEHMRAEFVEHGFAPARVHRIPFPLQTRLQRSTAAAAAPVGDAESIERRQSDPVRLLFVGRIEPLKGGRPLLAALPMVARALGRPVKLTVAGDGRALPDWQRRAAQVVAEDSRIAVTFAGWSDDAGLEQLAEESDLLVVPSLWPEPFGLVGVEAGLHGVPAAAFAVGGISEWLHEGINGHLAPGDPPTAAGLAAAIVKCLAEPAHYARLREGALKISREFTLERHLRCLLPILQEAAGTHDAVDGDREKLRPAPRLEA